MIEEIVSFSTPSLLPGKFLALEQVHLLPSSMHSCATLGPAEGLERLLVYLQKLTRSLRKAGVREKDQP